MAATVPLSSHKSSVFEFTKRKRWADLLITELADVLVLVLSPTAIVLYCGPAVTDLLGWRDVDLIDRDIKDFILPEDHSAFSRSLARNIKGNVDLLSYVHIKSKDAPLIAALPQYTLFEVKGYAHLLPDDGLGCKCVFAVAKPYPNKNTAILNSFQDLKWEKELLQQRANELRNLAPASFISSSTTASAQISPVYVTSSMNPCPLPASASTPPLSSDTTKSFYSSSNLALTMFDNATGSENSPFQVQDSAFTGGNFYAEAKIEDENEEGSKKKKAKKSHVAELYVCMTCGRTDSPEWRKGPSGPKTLCNACGLRWAKQMRKCDDPIERGVDAAV